MVRTSTYLILSIQRRRRCGQPMAHRVCWLTADIIFSDMPVIPFPFAHGFTKQLILGMISRHKMGEPPFDSRARRQMTTGRVLLERMRRVGVVLMRVNRFIGVRDGGGTQQTRRTSRLAPRPQPLYWSLLFLVRRVFVRVHRRCTRMCYSVKLLK
jgi:hypothetical protein